MGQTVELLDCMTANPDQRRGRPCNRGMRMRVSDVLDELALVLTAEHEGELRPDLERDDVGACLRFASRRMGDPVLAA
ncbi:DUF433 domain-containing protein [Gemmatimonas sp.]|uniref:DUF433 domain-containing protein n=1 Tax=Gemmatimonas sp. TaxID=1962908 RepID=UPI003983D3AE